MLMEFVGRQKDKIHDPDNVARIDYNLGYNGKYCTIKNVCIIDAGYRVRLTLIWVYL